MDTTAVKSVCVTGHRKDFDEFAVVASLKEAIFLAYIKGFTNFCTGMALGVDTLFAREVIKLKEIGKSGLFSDITLTAYVPFEGQELKWPQPDQQEYTEILSDCDSVIHCSKAGYGAKKFFIRNRRMVDESQAVIAVYDGREGGTQDCANYAWSKGRWVYVIDPKTGRAKWKNKRAAVQ